MAWHSVCLTHCVCHTTHDRVITVGRDGSGDHDDSASPPIGAALKRKGVSSKEPTLSEVSTHMSV